MYKRCFSVLCIAALGSASIPAAAQAQSLAGPDGSNAAAAFGALQQVSAMSLSPDAKRMAYIAPVRGQANALVIENVAKDVPPKVAFVASGNPERLASCAWITSERLSCLVGGVLPYDGGYRNFSRVIAVNIDGSNIKMLSSAKDATETLRAFAGGGIIDWKAQDGANSVLMERVFLPTAATGVVGSSKWGYGVESVDSVTLRHRTVEAPRQDAVEYITDGQGTVRIMGIRKFQEATGMAKSVTSYFYRQPGSREWQKLSDYDYDTREGFDPHAVDPDLNVAYGLKKKDGRLAAFSIALDGSLKEALVFAHPQVDVYGYEQVGRAQRVVGVIYTVERTRIVYTDPVIDKVVTSLHRALPHLPQINIVDSDDSGDNLLIRAQSDDQPGIYYMLDRKSKELKTLLPVRPELAGVPLAKVKSITYPAADGQSVPAYLTLPVGSEGKHLPAIVMPHGGPSSRDEWGFDWLPQFFAARGYAVLQPNFRGSEGFGDAWFGSNGMRGWRVSIGDVTDAGRWLVKQGIANPARLGIVGWSYGGYAALQSAVVDPGLFKAVVAIAPVTDFEGLKARSRGWSNYRLLADFVGSGSEAREGSPALNADKIRVPVLLFHGEQDTNVDIEQSRKMAARLRAASGSVELTTWPNLDHQLEDSVARTELLGKSDAFLRKAFGM